jgi:ubiquinone/menaquinone biosynthesis C-methylase UbiE
LNKKKINIPERYAITKEYWKNVYHNEKEFYGFVNHEMRNRRKLIVDKLAEHSTKENSRLLDCGCGSGIMTKDAIKLGYDAIGIDISMEMIKIANNYNNHKFAVGSISKLPFKDNSFDGIICIGVIQYINKEIDVFSEFCRVLKPKGFIIFTLPNIATLKYLCDPYYYLIRLPIFIFKSIKKKIFKKNNNSVPDYDQNSDFSNKRYRINQLNSILQKLEFKIDDIIAVGYGPLTFFRKQIFELNKSLKLSTDLTKAVNKSNIKIFKAYANRWIYDVEKTD